MSLCATVIQHGGIAEIRTHRAEPHFDRRTGTYRCAGWANTISCRDGWRRTLTKRDERELGALPEPMRAERHVIED